MSQPAVKQNQLPDNNANQSGPTADAGDDTLSLIASADQPLSIVAVDNPVKQSVDKFREIIHEMDDLQEDLRARGVPVPTTRSLVKLDSQKHAHKLSQAIDNALADAEKSFGKGVLQREVLEDNITSIVNLENDLTRERGAAREAGMDVKVLWALAQMMQQNPADKGSLAVNTFLSYAQASGVKIDQASGTLGELNSRSDAVLPNIARKSESSTDNSRAKLAQEVVIGLVIGVVIIAMLL